MTRPPQCAITHSAAMTVTACLAMCPASTATPAEVRLVSVCCLQARMRFIIKIIRSIPIKEMIRKEFSYLKCNEGFKVPMFFGITFIIDIRMYSHSANLIYTWMVSTCICACQGEHVPKACLFIWRLKSLH